MRRIFGGATLPGSSTSTSLSSDALPSPGITPSNSISHNERPSPSGNSSDHNSFDEHKKAPAGWFGALGAVPGINSISGTITGRHARSNTQSSIADVGKSNGMNGNGVEVLSRPSAEESEDDSSRLPFSSSRIRSPPPTHSSPVHSPRGHARNASNYSHAYSAGARLSAAGGNGNVGARAFSPTGEEGVTDEKDTIMVELLSGQASVEAKEYSIMEWDEMQETKKKHAILATKVGSLSRSLALESKLRDSATKLVRLSRPASASNPPNRVTREQAEIQLQTATMKVNVLSEELYKVGWEEAELRTKLLKHTAGVLGLAVRRKEEEEAGMRPTSLRVNALSPGARHSLASQRQQQSPSPTSSSGARDTSRFDGNSFFAGNKEAIVPQGRGSPYTSPQLGAQNGAFSSLPPDPTIIKELEETIRELREKLTATEERMAMSERDSRRRVDEEVAQARRSEEAVKNELMDSQRVADEAQRELRELRKEVESAREAAREAKDSAASAKKAMIDSEREKEDLKKEAMTMRCGSSDHQRDVASARQEATELSKKLSMAQLEKEEAEHRIESFEDKVSELEEEISIMRRAHESELRRMRADLESKKSADEANSAGERQLQAKVDQHVDEKKKVVQALGDVLRRHRTRPVLGSAIRDLPAFDDTTDHEDLPSYLSSTLDSHFDRISSHVTTLNEDIALLHAEHEEIRTDLQKELKVAVDHRERWRGEAETHRRAKEVLETEHRDLQSKVQSHEEKLSSVSAMEQNASNAAAEEAKLRQEIATAQSKISSLEALIAENTAQHTSSLKPLQDLWKNMPTTDSRSAAAGSDDLSVLKTAFEAPRKPMGSFLADVTGTGAKFSLEGFADRVKALVESDHKLVGKLIAMEATKDKDRLEAEKAKKALAENSSGLQTYQKQIKELEERMEVSANQEVTMLERLNDLTESLESTRGEKRKIEATLSTLQNQQRPLEADKARLEKSLADAEHQISQMSNKPDDSAKVAQLENEVEELQDQLQDVNQELDDAKKREQKQRSQLLDQLSTAEQEVSSLKTQLRQEQRKKAKA